MTTAGDAPGRPTAGRGRPAAPTPSGRRRAAPLLGLLAVAFIGFVALGTWQVERRAWKLDLIRRVDARIHAPASDAPGPAAWPRLRAADDEYRHVRVTGVFQPAAATLVQAVTDLGPGFWLMTPLRRSDDGGTVLVNRGFVADAGAARSAAAPAIAARSPVTVTGLLRPSEPGGGFLRHNDPAAGRWYSRDVAAIAAASRLGGAVAPYFIDADAAGDSPAAEVASGQPVGGLTVVAFHNNHLVYALTWYALAVLSMVGAWQLRLAARR